MPDKETKTYTFEERAEEHMQSMSRLFHTLLNDECDIWPELKAWPYKEDYKMSPEDYHTKYDIAHKYYTYGPEGLFKLATMKGASRDELVRIMKYILITLEYQHHCLDISKSFEDLGIQELYTKYMKRRPRNGHW